jgi:hypothetical protein
MRLWLRPYSVAHRFISQRVFSTNWDFLRPYALGIRIFVNARHSHLSRRPRQNQKSLNAVVLLCFSLIGRCVKLNSRLNAGP